MLIQIASDLHIEVNGPDVLRTKDIVGDVLVLAGDIHGDPVALLKWMQDLTDKPIVYVLGNHEYYRHVCTQGFKDYDDVLWKRPRTYCLDRQFYKYQEVNGSAFEDRDVTFLGTTLWTDLNQGRDKALFEAGLNDAIKIGRGTYESIAEFTMDENVINRAFLVEELDKPRGALEKRVVVTHHAPGPLSIAPKFFGDPLNGAFVNSGMSKANSPDIWIHGHTHTSFDYRHGGTRFICNPHGYGRENPEFQRELVVEI